MLDLNDWAFYVLSKKTINREFKDQKRVALSRIKSLCGSVEYDRIKEEVDICLEGAKKTH